jgi:D-alanyl-lipoteichoic acid acyltransferase DltB (MBOAT superfamily)
MPKQRRWRWFMLAASYVFYGTWDWRFVLLLAASTFANQAFAVLIDRARSEGARSRRLALAVTANLATLGWFKYAGFLGENTSSALRFFGVHIDPPFTRVILPIGISFFTFQALSYVIDVRRKRLRPTSLLDFAVYLSFFPHLVAGPIVRAGEFLPQLRGRRDARRVDAGLAFWLIAIGLIKKVVIATYLATHAADSLFSVPFQHGGVEALVGVYAYAIQIYADFSGYTDIAIGLALLLGFRFPLNFDAPYTATSLQDFWRRWHMTLSRWLRDYLYIPLGGSQNGRWRAYRNLLIVMVLGGLWHGAAWTFVAWGALHGGGLAFERWWGEWRERRRVRRALSEGLRGERYGDGFVPVGPGGPLVLPDDEGAAYGVGGTAVAVLEAPAPAILTLEPPPARRLWLRRLVTFHLVCAGWVFFRARSFSDATTVFSRIVHGGGAAAVNPMVVVVIVGMIAAQYVPAAAVDRVRARFAALRAWQMAIALGSVLLLVDVLGPDGIAPFIYFRF